MSFAEMSQALTLVTQQQLRSGGSTRSRKHQAIIAKYDMV